MHASIGAAGAVNNGGVLGNASEHADDLALDGGLMGLHLPAVEVRAVIGDGELEIAHANGIMPASDGAHEAAAGFDGGAALAALRAIFGLVAGDG